MISLRIAALVIECPTLEAAHELLGELVDAPCCKRPTRALRRELAARRPPRPQAVEPSLPLSVPSSEVEKGDVIEPESVEEPAPTSSVIPPPAARGRHHRAPRIMDAVLDPSPLEEGDGPLSERAPQWSPPPLAPLPTFAAPDPDTADPDAPLPVAFVRGRPRRGPPAGLVAVPRNGHAVLEDKPYRPRGPRKPKLGVALNAYEKAIVDALVKDPDQDLGDLGARIFACDRRRGGIKMGLALRKLQEKGADLAGFLAAKQNVKATQARYLEGDRQVNGVDAQLLPLDGLEALDDSDGFAIAVGSTTHEALGEPPDSAPLNFDSDPPPSPFDDDSEPEAFELD